MDLTRPAVVDLAIGELHLTGLGQHDGTALRSAVEGHLADLVREQGLPVARTAPGPDLVHVAVDLDWDGRGGRDGLARVLARRIYEAMGS